MTQSKTAKLVPVPLLAEVRQMLDTLPRKGKTILTNLSGEIWTYGGFSTMFNEEMDRLGIKGPLSATRAAPRSPACAGQARAMPRSGRSPDTRTPRSAGS